MDPQHLVPGDDRQPPDALPEIGPGLTIGMIDKALRRGQEAADYTTGNHPRTSAGTNKWTQCVGSLRADLVKCGWIRRDDWNIPQIWTPDGSTAIVVRAGNQFTGTADHRMDTARRIGKQLRELLQPESFQTDLFVTHPIVVRRPVVYLLLGYHVVNERMGLDEIRVELSQPQEISRKGRVKKWKRRYVLPTIDLNHEPTTRRTDAEDSGEDFDVRRRNA